MSKYAINKLMNLVNSDPRALAAYRADPEGFTAHWEEEQPLLRLDGRTRRAFHERDHVTLYALGAHPHLLYSFATAVWEHEISRAEISRDFKERTKPIGHPDFET